MDFPRLVFKSASVHSLVNDEAEFNEQLKAGWFPSVPEAMEGVKVEAVKLTDDNAPPTRAELEEKAFSVGIKFDGRTSDAKLEKLIAESVK